MVDYTGPAARSSAYGRMEQAWFRINDILAGPERIRACSVKYLPKYEAEDDKEYTRRLLSSPWRPEFEDALRTLVNKPFGKDVALASSAPPSVTDLVENIDGCGNNLTQFSRFIFRGGVAKGLHAILVEYPVVGAGATLKQERTTGGKPYWVSIRAEDILALYTAFHGGREIVTHVRLIENEITQLGFDEISVYRVRVFDRAPVLDANNKITGYDTPTWAVWETDGENGYSKIDDGVLGLPEIPLVLFWTGEREGCHYVKPPLNDLADMQIELYRALSRHEETLTYAGSPMLQAQGIEAPAENDTSFAVGPKRVLFAPPGIDGGTTGWSYIAPQAGTITAGADHVAGIQADMRRLGMQPMSQQSAGRMTNTVTATATSVDSNKANSTVEAWALGLKDVLEQALVFTAQWLGETNYASIEWSPDFSALPFAQAPLTALQAARTAGDIDHETFLLGLRRFDVLPPDVDVQDIIAAVIEEGPSDPSEQDLSAAMAGLGPQIDITNGGVNAA